MKHTVFLFGEAERGDFCTPLSCHSLAQLSDQLGNPPGESKGIPYAIQSLMYNRDLIFFRVKEEGYSVPDYMKGFRLLQKGTEIRISALCMPGVGDPLLINASTPICHLHQSLLIIEEKDLYDYLTSK